MALIVPAMDCNKGSDEAGILKQQSMLVYRLATTVCVINVPGFKRCLVKKCCSLSWYVGFLCVVAMNIGSC